MPRISLLLIATLFFSGCASDFTTVAIKPPPEYSILGKASGSACGSLGILVWPLYAIPLGINSRTERAYEAAIASVPNASGLINVSVEENWYWWIIGTVRCVTVKGEAIR